MNNPIFKNIAKNDVSENSSPVLPRLNPHKLRKNKKSNSLTLAKSSMESRKLFSELPNSPNSSRNNSESESSSCFFLESCDNDIHLPEKIFMFEGEAVEDFNSSNSLLKCPLFLKKSDRVGVIYEELEHYFAQDLQTKKEGYVPKKTIKII